MASSSYSILEQDGPSECPELRASFLSRVTYWWVQPLLNRGYSKPLEEEDLWALPPLLESNYLAESMQIDWNKRYPLLRAIIKSFVLPHWIIIPIRLIISFFMFVNPFLLRYLVSNIKDASSDPSHLWIAAMVLFLCSLTQATLFHMNYWLGMKCGMRARGALMAAISRKALRTAGYARSHFGTGSISNLISVDTDAARNFFWNSVYDLWVAPFQLVVLLVLLCIVIGPFGLLGVMVMALAIPFNPYLVRKAGKDKEQALHHSDRRVRLVHEMIQGIRLLKLYSWETYFTKRISDIRSIQLNFLRASFGKWICSIFLNVMVPLASLIVTFGGYTLSGHELSPAIAFTALALFNNIRTPLEHLPNAVDALMLFLLAAKRIEDFLRVEEVKDYHRDHVVGPDQDVLIKDGCFVWAKIPEQEGGREGSADSIDADHDEKETMLEEGLKSAPTASIPSALPCLDGLEFRAPAKKLTVVVGVVGSGKSSLLASLLGEVNRVRGEVSMQENVAYTPQTAWLMTSSLRNNILFGRPFDGKRYRRVLHSCALLRDLDLLPAGDMTEIGEKGINLSGGQKQRVSLARALYRDADCYLLDDPLSAVDAHVGKWLFEKVVCGAMAGRTRILVTHQLQFIAGADHIVLMENGRVAESGTYQELLSRGIDFEAIVSKRFGDKVESPDREKERQSEVIDAASPLPSPSSTSLRSSTDGETVELGNFLEIEDNRPIGGDRSNGKEGSGQAGNQGNIIKVEERQTGDVGWSIYKFYFSNTRSPAFLAMVVFVFVVCQGLFIGGDYWLSLWSTRQLGADRSDRFYLGVYILLILSFGVLLLVRSFLIRDVTFKAAANLHQRLLGSIVRAPPSFFDATPTGRIINRFSKDQDSLDQSLPPIYYDCLTCGSTVVGGIFLIIFITPMFVVPLVGISILYYWIQKYYRASSREMKRLDSITRSPILSHFSEMMAGLTVIRAFRMQSDFIHFSQGKIDTNQRIFFYSFSVNRWLGFRLEFISSCSLLFASVFAILARSSLSPGLVGLSLTSALSIAMTLNWTVRQLTELEVQMNACERVVAYVNVEPEAPLIISENRPPVGWPDRGTIQVRDLTIRYREDLDPVLNRIDFDVGESEHIGIVGRTGAGKSTLTLALFRMIEASQGSILIDGIDISRIGLSDLRTSLSIIPQDPVLFSGTVRSNLDPLSLHDDAALWRALDRVHLRGYIEKQPLKLDHEVTESGDTFSVGQRQLLCLGRALLRDTKILVMDEATASLDFQTDSLIKQTIRDCFQNKTLITIAHRLDTILEYDRVFVFESGSLVEAGKPSELALQPSSKFGRMLQTSRQRIAATETKA